MNDQTPQAMLSEIKTFTGLSEIALAKDLKVSQPTVNRILNGQGSCSGSTLMAIFRLYEDLKEGKLIAAPAREPVEPAAA